MKTFLILFFAMASFQSFAVAQTSEGKPSFFSCPKQTGSEQDLTLHGRFFLHRDFLHTAYGNETLGIREAIFEELRYAQGWFVNHHLPHERITLKLSQTPVIQSIKVKSVKYPYALGIDEIHHPDVKTDHPYLLAAIHAQQTKKTEPGLEIEFTASTLSLTCGDANFAQTEIKLPGDPFLAYWLVPASERRQITWRKSTFTINPCAESELADIPDPHYYWYFWEPDNAGVDDHKQTFSCRKLLEHGNLLTTASVQLEKSHHPLSSDFHFQIAKLPVGRPIHATVLFGVLDPKKSDVHFLQSIGPKQPGTWSEFAKSMPKTTAPDPGIDNLLAFFSAMSKILDAESAHVTYAAKDEELTIQGHLRLSSRAIEIKVYFGETDVLTTAAPEYWKNLASALREDDVVLYTGHSGLGENARLARILENTGENSEHLLKDSPPYQLIGFFSCFSFSYFGEEIAEARSRIPNRETDLLRTGSPFSTEIGDLMVLEQLDRDLADVPSARGLAGAPIYSWGPADLVLLTRFSPLRD